MRAFHVPAGTQARALRQGAAMVETDVVTTIRAATYFEEDVAVDPLGNLGIGPNSVTIGGAFAQAGWYGFRLPTNARGYSTLLVPSNSVEVW